MSQNLISQVMTDLQRDAMLTDLTSFDTKFNSYKTSLTPDQIKHLPKLRPEDVAMLDAALLFAQQNPTLVPTSINLVELAKDVALAKQLVPVNTKATQEANQTGNSLIAVLSDAYKTGLQIYRTAQAQGRTPETIPFLDSFGARFAHVAKATPAPTP